MEESIASYSQIFQGREITESSLRKGGEAIPFEASWVPKGTPRAEQRRNISCTSPSQNFHRCIVSYGP